MDVEFGEEDLQKLEDDPDAKSRFDDTVVRAFRRRMRQIRDATDERDLRALKSLHFEKLKGDRNGQYSIRLNKQWRLIFEIEIKEEVKIIIILSIEDYHK